MGTKGALGFARLITQYIIGVFIFIIVGSLPVFLRDLSFNFENYFRIIKELTVKIFTLSNLTYDGEHEMLPAVIERYLLSMKTLGIAFFAAIALAFIVSYLIVLVFQNKQDYILSFIEIIRSVPDVVWMFLLQAVVILVFKVYGIKLAQVVSLGSDNQAVILPLISLSLPIMLFLTQIIVLKIYEELEKQYVAFAKAKGLSYLYLLNVHVIRNIRQGLLGHFKTIIWMMLSTLLMVEFIFNLDGLMLFNIKYLSIELFVFSCILLFTPFFIIYRLIDIRRTAI